MKAKARQPLDFSAAAEGYAAGTYLSAPIEPAPDGVPDLDLSIGEVPETATATADTTHLLPLNLGYVRPLTSVRNDYAPARDDTPIVRPLAAISNRGVDPKAADAGSGTAIYAAATFVSALWALAPIAYAIGYRQVVSPLKNDPFAIAVFGLLAAGPAAFVFIAAYMIRQGAKLAAEARRTREMAQQMLTPAALAAAGAADAVAAVREQIEHAAQMASDARHQMLALRETLATESAALAAATSKSAASTIAMTGMIAEERGAIQALAEALDAQSAAITDAIGRQARMVAEASDLAETQLREAEAALAARAADLTIAAVNASEATRNGAEDIARQAARLEMAGDGVSNTLRVVDEGVSQQRAALVQVAESLRVEQEDFAVQAESQTAKMADLAEQARLGADELSETAARGAEVLSGLITAAAQQFEQIADAARTQQDTISDVAAKSFEALRAAAGEQKIDLEQEMKAAIESMAAAADQARLAAQGQVDVAKSRVDQLNEAAFAAGQRADAVFEARMNEARDLIEQSAMMAEQAGVRSAQRLDEGVAAARVAVNEVERLLSDVGARTGSLQAQAQAQVEAVHDAVEHGMGELLASARRAAKETQAIDAAFQERVKRNYDMLSEAVSLMGAVAGSAGETGRNSVHALRPSELLRPVSPAESDLPRQRLRLTPTTADDVFRTVFEAERPANPVLGERLTVPMSEVPSWTWKGLLQGLNRSPAAKVASVSDPAPVVPASEEFSDGRQLAMEISQMGIDAAALLPRLRIDEISASVQTGDLSGAREVVKRLAPAAIRRLVRRLFSDRQLRVEAEGFLLCYGGMVQEAAAQDRQGFLVATLLGSESGRVYLLLDAAAGDIG